MSDLHFPDGFLWGAATAAHQVEGNNITSDWWRSEFEGRLPYRSGDACDSWNRWPEDVALLSEMGLNAYRLSIEWARVEPEPGRFDAAVLDRYRQMLLALRQAGIEPMVTLHHFTSPAWFTDAGHWANAASVAHFARYASRAAHALGDLVEWWITVNEPSILGLKGYLEGAWPPHRPGDLQGYGRMMRHIAAGHVAAREVLRRRRSDARVSIAFALWPMQPLHAWNPVERAVCAIADWFWQGRILRRTAHALDWIGVNYYTRIRMGWPPVRSGDVADRTDFGWEIYPAGLYEVLDRAGRLGLPVVITEHGISDHDDDLRPRYIVDHLRQAHRAIQSGVDLRGYLHWSLMDNFEWADGYSQRFGLAEVDCAAYRRRPRPSAALYGDIARANGITDAALDRHRAVLGRAPALAPL